MNDRQNELNISNVSLWLNDRLFFSFTLTMLQTKGEQMSPYSYQGCTRIGETPSVASSMSPTGKEAFQVFPRSWILS